MTPQKLTPRQKMINMLYLVLTAILALNVSSEVLDAFKVVNDGIGKSNTSLLSKNAGIYTDFEKQYRNDPKRAEDAYRKAQKAHALSTRLHELLEQHKQYIIRESGGVDAETGKILRDDDVNIATRLFVENGGNIGKDLQKQIETTRYQLLQLLEDEDRKEAELNFALKKEEGVGDKSWEFAKFNHVPAVAAVTLLSKYQNDLLSAEGYVVDKLYNSVYQGTEKVDQFAAKVIAPSSYIIQGESYNADVMVAAYSSSKDPEVFLGQFTPQVTRDANGAFVEIFSTSEQPPLVNPVRVDVRDGLGKLTLAGNATGDKKYTGVVRVKSNAGDGYKFYPFEGEYRVAPKMAVVSPTMMNVLYIGLENPISLSVPGVAQSDVSARFTENGTLFRNQDGSYSAKVTKAGTAKVVVTAKVNGKEMLMGEQLFRIKNVPSPVSTLDGVYEGGKITLARMKSTRGIVPLLKTFEYGAKFTVESYTVSIKSRKDGNISLPVMVNGPEYNPRVREMITKQVQAGDDVYFDEIWVRGPAGDKRRINPISFAVVR